jgi:hypothetical protein
MKPIKNILNLSVAELFSVFLNNSDERYVINDIDFRFHIRNNTDDFDSKSLKILYAEIRKFIEYQILLEYNDQIYTLRDLLNFFDDANYSYTPSQLLLRLSKIVFDNLMEIEYINHDAVIYIRRYNIVFKEILEELEFEINENQKNILPLTQNEISNSNKQVKDLVFKDLFKKEYRSDEIQSKFKQWLISEQYVNQSNDLICVYIKFARLFYLLRDEGIVRPIPNQTKVMRTLFGNFGVEVVESYDPENDAPQVVRKTVTGESAETHVMLGMTQKEKNTLLSIFKSN